MPELPEVEHVVRALRHTITGRTIVASEVRLPKLIAPLSAAAFQRKVKGSTINGVSRRGKFILIECHRGRNTGSSRSDFILAVHLRMTGKFLYLRPDDDVPKHSHAIFYFDNDRRLVFRDQRQFGVMKLIAGGQLARTKGIKELAPEPFGEDFNPEYLKSVLQRSRRSLKTLLLDQTKVLGLGNIYASEALFRARINPFKIASQLSTRRVPLLYEAVRDVLQIAVEHIRGPISLEEGFSYGAGFGNFWQVYDREGEPCVNCSTKIRRATHGGRSTYWCPRCQRR